MDDTDKHERIDAPMHPAVIEWIELRVNAARHYREAADALTGAER